MCAYGRGIGCGHPRRARASAAFNQHHPGYGALLLVHHRIRTDAHRKTALRVYGSGLLSSFGEIEHAIESPEVQRHPIQLEWAINQAFEIDHYQPLLFMVDSFDHLFNLVDQLERWMREGKLDNVAPGEPAVNERDLRSFLHRE